MNCTSCNHEVHTGHCAVADCGCGVCVWPGVGTANEQRMRVLLGRLEENVLQLLQTHEDVRQLRESIDALAVEIKALARAVDSLGEDVAGLRGLLQGHIADETVHAWAGDNGGG